MLDQVFAGIAREFSALGLGPFVDAQVITQVGVVRDSGGSIASSSTPTTRACQVQIDACTESMRAQAGFTEKDVRLLVIDLTGTITTDESVKVLAGPNAGTWSIEWANPDPAGIGFECRGRLV